MDKQKALRIEEIFIPSSQVAGDYFCENFIIFPEGKEKNGGHILGVLEINATPTEHAQKISNTIISNLKDHYYRQIVTSPDPQKLNLETVFEHALQKTNEQVLQLIQIGQIKLILENINFLIGVVKQNELDTDLHFSHRGNIDAYLIHKTKKSNYKIINILDANADQDNKVKIFSSIISGKIFLPDSLIIANEGFSKYFSAEKINQLIGGRPIKEVIEDFKILLHKRPSNYDKTYSSIVVKQEDIHLMERQQASQKSINELVTTQKDTEKFLAPALGINIKARLKSIIPNLKGMFQRKQKSKAIAIEEIRASTNFFEKIAGKIKRLPNIIKRQKQAPEKTVKKKKLFGIISYKLLFVIIIALIISFTFSIVWLYNRQQEKEKLAEYNQIVQTIETKLNQAEASFLFRNTKKSLAMMSEAKEMIDNLPQAKETEQQNYDKLLNQYSSLQNKLLKIETVEANEIINLDNLSSDSPKIELLSSSVLSIADNNNLHILNLAANQPQMVNTEIQSNIVSLCPFDENNLYVLFENNQLYQYLADSSQLNRIDISSKGIWSDFKVYNKHLYFLAPQNNQIFKLRNVGSSSFGPPQEWLDETVDFSKSASLAIDGDIYILNSDGKIQKFLSGAAQTFSQQNVEPAIQNTTKIYTNTDSNFIYILDKPTKRVIVLTKTGLVIVQYSVSNVGEIDDMAIDEKNKKLYIIENQKVMAVTMKHL